jgi:hypothetical protein
MRAPTTSFQTYRLAGAMALALALLVLPACTLDDDDPPDLIGPSETGISVQLSALPDTLNADGVSQSVVELVARDQNGAPASGRAILFEHDGDGYLSPSTDSTFVGPIQQGLVMATDTDGVARVVYVAGTHVGRTVTVVVRPYSFDATRRFLSAVEIWQE